MARNSADKLPLEDLPARKGLTANERLALIGLIDAGARQGWSDSPMVADLFDELSDLVNRTVSGAKIDRMHSDGPHNGFKIIEINAESGENLGRLNMLYLNKPIPCYYLVYVEVAAPFRNKGLGNRILKVFREFLIEKSALGILDNIIPDHDPTYDIYEKLNWQPLENIVGTAGGPIDSVYMVFVPPSLSSRDLKDPVVKLIHHLRRRRPAIEMRDNEVMVQRTIEEFQDLYVALLAYFEDRITNGEPDSLMRFMFTRFVTKLLGFRRRIGQLLGYTGGESLEQIVLHPEIRSLHAQSYAPRELADSPALMSGSPELWLDLPEELKKHPARFIEALHNYRRPNLVSWLKETGKSSGDVLTVGDLMDLGFDPTRLKEMSLPAGEFIFERIQARMLPLEDRKKTVLERVAPETAAAGLNNTRLYVNLPLLTIRDRGNGYLLRSKVAGVHWEEAVEQLQSAPSLKSINQSLKLDRMVIRAARRASEWLRSRLETGEEALMDRMSFFVSWNFETNQPAIIVDFSGSYLESVWIA
jgi:hypothetical protein